MTEGKTPRMIACPECFKPLPAIDLRVQIKHMERHPEVTAWHLRELGYHRAADRFLRERKVGASLKIK